MNGSVSPPGTFVLRRGLERLRCERDAQAKPARFLRRHGAQRLRLRRARRREPPTRRHRLRRPLRAASTPRSIAALPAAFVAPVVAQLAAEFRALHDDGHLRGLTRQRRRGFARLGLRLSGGRGLRRRAVRALPPRAGVVGAVRRSARRRRALLERAARRSRKERKISSATRSRTRSKASRKSAASSLLIAVGFKLGGGIVGFFLGPLCALIYLGLRLRRRYANAQPHDVRYDWRRILNAGAGAAAATIAVTLMGSADVVLVKHYFDAHAAGLYAAASLGGKMLLYLVGFIPTVLLPQAADRHARGAQTREVLVAKPADVRRRRALRALRLQLLRHRRAPRARRTRLRRGAPLLVTYGMAMVLLALTNALTYYGIATHRLAFTVPLFICTLGTLAAIVDDPSHRWRRSSRSWSSGTRSPRWPSRFRSIAQRHTTGRRSTV